MRHRVACVLALALLAPAYGCARLPASRLGRPDDVVRFENASEITSAGVAWAKAERAKRDREEAARRAAVEKAREVVHSTPRTASHTVTNPKPKPKPPIRGYPGPPPPIVLPDPLD